MYKHNAELKELTLKHGGTSADVSVHPHCDGAVTLVAATLLIHN